MVKHNDIEQLKAENYKQRLELALIRGGIPEVMRVVEEELDRQREIIQAQREYIDGLERAINEFAPVEALRVRHFTEEEAHELIRQHRLVPHKWEHACSVSYRFAIRSGEKDSDVTTVADFGMFLGTTEELIEAIEQRVSPLIKTEPMIDQIRRAGLPYEVTDDALRRAVAKLATYYFDPDYYDRWEEEITPIFDSMIWSDIQRSGVANHFTLSLGRKRFRETVIRSFRAMDNERQKYKKRNKNGGTSIVPHDAI